jgi:nucleoside-diphosphate-sugar epimerase
MKILITGSSGFIGKELVNHLRDKHEILKFDLLNNQDILNLKQLKQSMQDCDIVVHLATHRKPYENKTFKDYFETNCQGTFNVVQAAMESGVKKFIYTSSTSYFGIENGIPYIKPIKDDNPIMTQHVKIEDLTCRDCDIAYSTSKVIGEQFLANFGLTKKMQVIILRIGPTRKRGEYRPFGELKLHLKIENVLQVLESAINSKKKLWYEFFTITDELEQVDISKAKEILNYKPI